MRIEFYYDVVCPFAYMASRRIEDIAARAHAELIWKPILLGGVFQHHQSPQVPAEVMSPPRARLNLLDILRCAELESAPLTMHPRHPVRTVNAMRLVLAADEATRPALSHELFAAYHQRNEDVDDIDVLAGIADRHGVDPARIRAPDVKQALFDASAEAAERGVFGVPTVFVDGEDMQWGADRLHFVEERLGLPRPPRTEPDDRTRKLTFFHDFSSPFSYLGSTAVEAVARRHGAQLERVPILLGALFRDIGTANVPLLTMSAAKQRWYVADMKRWAAWRGVPFTYPSVFPIRTVTALRVAIQQPAATDAIYRATWGEDRNVSDPDVLRGVLDDAGFDGAELIAGAQDPVVKAQLRANTQRAEAAGVCGVPTWRVDDGPLFWGQDRQFMVEQALTGWVPRAG